MTKKVVIFLVLISNWGNIFSKNENDSIIALLNNVIKDKESYIKIKEQNISNIKQLLQIGKLPPEQIYDINTKLCDEYRKYITDSAVYYTQQNVDIAQRLGRNDLLDKANLDLAWLFSTQGLYIEAKDLLDDIDCKSLQKKDVLRYYETYSSFCSHYGQSNNHADYYRKSELYRDSLLMQLDPHSIQYQITYATKILYEQNRDDAERMLLSLLENSTDQDTDRAVIAYLLGLKYKEDENIELEQKYFSISAITDIKNAVRNNASFHDLALMYYRQGNIDEAYKFIEFAINDAIACNVRYRAIEITASYPIINALYQAKETKQKSQLQSYLVLISIMSVFLVIGIIYVYKQMKRLSRIRKELYRTNLELNKLNTDLHKVNNSLQESNHIKEEYITHFFDLCSSYINKMEDYRKSLNKLAANNRMEELFKMLKSTSFLESELDDLYKNFDSIFLNLYPTFVEDFNKLLLVDERICPKPGELLNTELRIFALIRLGITDSVKIASFLRYSLRTVYNYRTKVRNKSAVSRDEFEDKVKEIGVFL